MSIDYKLIIITGADIGSSIGFRYGVVYNAIKFVNWVTESFINRNENRHPRTHRYYYNAFFRFIYFMIKSYIIGGVVGALLAVVLTKSLLFNLSFTPSSKSNLERVANIMLH